jgi:hypothetical protein
MSAAGTGFLIGGFENIDIGVREPFLPAGTGAVESAGSGAAGTSGIAQQSTDYVPVIGIVQADREWGKRRGARPPVNGAHPPRLLESGAHHDRPVANRRLPMKNPLDSLWGTVISGLVLTAILYCVVRAFLA